MEKRIRTEFGYFAENTLEELRKTSFRDKSLIKSPIVDSDPDIIHSTPIPKSTKPNKSVKSTTSNKVKKTVEKKQNQTQTKGASNLKKDLSNYLSKYSLQPKSLSTPANQLVVQQNLESDDDDDDDDEESEELDENHPLVRYENRSFWIDKEYQIQCLKSAIEMVKNDESGLFRAALKQRAMETLNLPVLPSGPNLMPRIIFNQKGEPSFEFYFQSTQSPLHVTEELPNMNQQILELTRILYELIRLNPISRKNNKQINYKNRPQIQYK